MARPGLFTHRKYTRLSRLLDSEALAAGHLELIWKAAYEAGDAQLGTSEDVEYLARWKGEAGVLSSSLLDAGFVDKNADGIFFVHDLMDHAPEYVQKRMQREEERRSKGKTLSEVRAKAGKRGALAKKNKQASGNRPASENHLPEKNKQTAVHTTPAPAPAPAPNNSVVAAAPGNGEAKKAADESEARGFAVGWISTECPTFLRSGVSSFTRLILRLGKSEALRMVAEARASPGVGNPFAWLEAKLDKQGGFNAAVAEKPKPFRREDN